MSTNLGPITPDASNHASQAAPPAHTALDARAYQSGHHSDSLSGEAAPVQAGCLEAGLCCFLDNLKWLASKVAYFFYQIFCCCPKEARQEEGQQANAPIPSLPPRTPLPPALPAVAPVATPDVAPTVAPNIPMEQRPPVGQPEAVPEPVPAAVSVAEAPAAESSKQPEPAPASVPDAASATRSEKPQEKRDVSAPAAAPAAKPKADAKRNAKEDERKAAQRRIRERSAAMNALLNGGAKATAVPRSSSSSFAPSGVSVKETLNQKTPDAVAIAIPAAATSRTDLQKKQDLLMAITGLQLLLEMPNNENPLDVLPDALKLYLDNFKKLSPAELNQFTIDALSALADVIIDEEQLLRLVNRHSSEADRIDAFKTLRGPYIKQRIFEQWWMDERGVTTFAKKDEFYSFVHKQYTKDIGAIDHIVSEQLFNQHDEEWKREMRNKFLTAHPQYFTNENAVARLRAWTWDNGLKANFKIPTYEDMLAKPLFQQGKSKVAKN